MDPLRVINGELKRLYKVIKYISPLLRNHSGLISLSEYIRKLAWFYSQYMHNNAMKCELTQPEYHNFYEEASIILISIGANFARHRSVISKVFAGIEKIIITIDIHNCLLGLNCVFHSELLNALNEPLYW